MSGKRPKLLVKAYSAIEGALTYQACGTVLVIATILITMEVLARLIANHSFYGYKDVVEFSILIIAFGCLGTIQAKEAHIKVELVTEKLTGRKAGKVINILTLLIAGLVAGIAFYISVYQVFHLINVNDRSENLLLLRWPFAIVMPLGYGFWCVRLCTQLLQKLK